MKNTARTITLLVITILLIVCTVNTVFAMSTADAKEFIDTSKQCSLELTYAIDSKKLEGLEIELFQAATVTENFQYSMTGDFADYPIEINKIKTQSEWNVVKDTIGAYITADKISPLATKTTDKNGIVKFEKLSVGIYYVRWTGNDSVDQVSSFAPFMISVPGVGEDGKWIYDVTAFPKPGMRPAPNTNKLTLVKLWKDGNQTDKRPSKISVDIFKNGDLYKNVELTAAENWSYTWDTDGTSTWTAVERNIPSGYTVTIQSKDGNSIQITNTNESNPPRPPQTGDDSHLFFWIIMMFLSGTVLILLGTQWRKERVEK